MDKKYPSLLFKERFKKVKKDAENLGQLAMASNRDVITLLDAYDENLYDQIIERSNEIDVDTIDLERACIRFIATEQPFAKDLMFIESTIRVISHIKRIGRLTYNIAQNIKKIQGVEIPSKILKELGYMGDYVQLMLSKSIYAFLNQNLEMAKELSTDDDKVDELFDSILNRSTSSMAENKELINSIIDIIFLARYFERIADRTVNIGSRTVFMMTLKRPEIDEISDDENEE